MKNIFVFLLLFTLLISVKIVEAAYYFVPPESLKLEDVNPQMKHKVQTRYNTKDDIPNQYKGKLIYNPVASNNLVNYRKNRAYSSFFVTSSVPDIKEIYYYGGSNDRQNAAVENIREDEYTFILDVGYYPYSTISLEFEYISSKSFAKFKNSLTDHLTQIEVIIPAPPDSDELPEVELMPQTVNGIRFDSYGYFINVAFESNYSRFIPMFGFGVGFITNSIIDTYLDATTVASQFKMRPSFAYNFFAGVEIALSSDWLFIIKHKTIKTIDFSIMPQNTKTSGIKFDFENTFISFGIKYIW